MNAKIVRQAMMDRQFPRDGEVAPMVRGCGDCKRFNQGRQGCKLYHDFLELVNEYDDLEDDSQKHWWIVHPMRLAMLCWKYEPSERMGVIIGYE